MSGIAGIIRFDGAPVEPGLVEGMTSAMSHRGPDSINHWVRGQVALGQCMLRTTPESLEETQPLANEDESLVLVMDGRVDNWEELRRELLGRGAVLRNRSDAELVLRSYEAWGRECLPHIDGDFALVVWDARRRIAFCARDRLGNKPFTYHWNGKTLAFSSELHAILRLPWVKPELNEGVLAEFLAADWYSRDETLWKEVSRLVAAHRMEVGEAGPRPELYWEPDLFAELPFRSDEEHVEYYRGLFGDTVRRLSRSHCTVAFEVSGGLDSSAIAAMAARLARKSQLPAPAVEGYTLDFHGEPDADELQFARATGEHIGVVIHEILPSYRPLNWYRDLAARFREFPGYPNGTMSLSLRETARANGSRVLLGGDGGDQWLGQGGFRHYSTEAIGMGEWRVAVDGVMANIRDFGVRRAAWQATRAAVANRLPGRLHELVRRRRHQSGRSGLWLTPRLQARLQERARRVHPAGPERSRWRSQRGQRQLLRDAYAVLAREMEERSACRAGIELRYPFWNAGIVQFAFSTPEWLRSRGRITKYVHRRAMQGILPEVVVERKTKAEFSVTFRKQLDACEAEAVSEFSRRRSDWVHPAELTSCLENRNDPSAGALSLWRLWGLVGCDAVVA